MHNVSLLYIEDDAQAQEHYSRGFSSLFKDVYIASNAKSGLQLYKEHQPDILLVDIELPDESGLSLIEEIRESDKESIIIVLSAFSQREQLLKAVVLGLYKYLIKPVGNKELLSVLNETIEIIEIKKNETVIELCDQIKWHNSKHLLFENETEIPLSMHENRLISLLYSNSNKIYSLWDIADFVWDGEVEPSQQAIKNLLNRLRKKVSVDFIRNHYGSGYQLCD